MDESDQLSRLWPCPKCGCQLFYSVLSFERGYENEAGQYVHFYPPAAYAVGVDMDNVRCAQCKLKFSLQDIYALDEPPEYIDLSGDDDCDDDCDCRCECEGDCECLSIEDSDPIPETEAEPEL